MGKALQTKVTKVKTKKTTKKAGVKQEDLPSEESSTAQEVDEPESEEEDQDTIETLMQKLRALQYITNNDIGV